MASQKTEILTPVGRLVSGSLYKPSTKDADGKPLTFASGESRVSYLIGIAIKKGNERHWRETTWGATIFAAGAAGFPQAHLSPLFAWKVVDGDSTVPNTRGKKPCDNEGYAGHWVLKFTSSYAPKVYREENGAYIQATEEGYIKPGYFIQVSGNVASNDSVQKPGVYLNHNMIAFAAYGQEIHFGPDANSVGFGGSLPAGAAAVPFASSTPLPAAPAAILPNPGFLNPPPPAPAPAPPAPPAPTAAKRMTDKAKGTSYEAFKAAQWSDEALISQGYMTV